MDTQLEDNCFEIHYKGDTAEVTFHHEKDREYWRLEWASDHSIDFLHLENPITDPVWKSETITRKKKINDLVALIDEKLS